MKHEIILETIEKDIATMERAQKIVGCDGFTEKAKLEIKTLYGLRHNAIFARTSEDFLENTRNEDDKEKLHLMKKYIEYNFKLKV